jgi:hypothetical protein
MRDVAVAPEHVGSVTTNEKPSDNPSMFDGFSRVSGSLGTGTKLEK